MGEIQVAPIYYYENDLLEIGDALVAELDRALDQIAEHPGRWKKIIENIHSFGPTKKFKWRIVYIENAEKIYIIAAYYSGEQDPLYWIERLAS